MRRCSYCGMEYASGNRCPVDDHALEEMEVHSAPSGPEQTDISKPAITSKSPDLVYPDYQWSARDAWKAVVMLIIFDFCCTQGLIALERHSSGFLHWRLSGAGNLIVLALRYAIDLLVVAYFARTETSETFKIGFGLASKSTKYVWWGIAFALFIRVFGHEMVVHHLGRGVSNFESRAFRSSYGIDRLLYSAPAVVLAPFCEECVYRGFLYRAFRGSYSALVSTGLIVAWTAWTHWTYYSHSALAAFDLSLLTIVQCQLRERTGSLWDTILCHFVFNGSGYLWVAVQSP